MIDDIGANTTAQSFDEAIRTGTSHCTIEITMEAGTYFFKVFNRESGEIRQPSKSEITTIAAMAKSIVEYIGYDFCFYFPKDERDYLRQKLRTCMKAEVERKCFYLTSYTEEPFRIEVFVNAIAKTDEAATN